MIVFRTLFFYLLLLAVIRLMGKRQVAQMEPSEFAVTMLVANLASIALEEPDTPIWSGAMAMGTVLVLEYMLSIVSLRSVRLRRVLCGKPVILIENGKILQDNLRRTHVTMDELSSHLRLKDVLDIQTVQYAILETNGDLSVFPFPTEKPASAREAKVRTKPQYLPVTILSDGRLLHENLKKAKKDGAWLRRVLQERSATVEGTWLLTVDDGGNVYYIAREAGE